MMFTPDAKTIKEYHTRGGKRHAFYVPSVKLLNDLEMHFSGKGLGKEIELRRPQESQVVKDHRVEIMVEITMPTVNAVFSSLQKIRKSTDWMVKFDKSKVPSIIIESERPEEYINDYFPQYRSITNWVFAMYLRHYLQDGNGFVAVQPMNLYPTAENEYVKPVPVIYEADKVIDYVRGEYFVMKSTEISYYKFDYQRQLGQGAVYYVYTPNEILRYVQINNNEDFREDIRYVHNLGYIPVFQSRGVVVQDNNVNTLCNSRLQPMIPFLKEAVREYSDLQAEVELHTHSNYWMYEPQECKKCRGSGQIMNEDSVKITCSTCAGHGSRVPGPYDMLIVKPTEPGANPAPTPPAGYITKDTNIVTIQDQRIDKHQYRALSAINFQFLYATPQNVSGYAKDVDKEELNNTVHSIAEDLVEMADSICSAVVDYRYSFVVPDVNKRNELKPEINVPEKYDLWSTQYLVDDVSKLMAAKVDATIVNAAQIDLAQKMFSTNEDVKEMVTARLKLDPFAGIADESLMTAYQAGMIDEVDFRIHYYIGVYIDRAKAEYDEFYDMENMEQLTILRGYANEDIAAKKVNAVIVP